MPRLSNSFSSLTPRTRGALWMLSWAIFYSMLNICVKKLGGFPKPLMIWVRTFVQLCFLVPVAFHQKTTLPTRNQFPWYILRICIVYAAIYCTYEAYTHLPLSIATSIGFIEPSMGILLAFIFFSLPMKRSQWIAVFIGYVGVLCVNYPMESGSQLKWVLVALLANLLAAIGRIITKHQMRKVPAHEVIFYGKLFFFPLVTFLAIYFFYKNSVNPYQFITSITAYQAFLLLGISFFSLISQYSYTQALNITHFDLVGPMTYSRILFAIPIGYFLFEEIPTIYALFGVLLIVISNYSTIRNQKKR